MDYGNVRDVRRGRPFSAQGQDDTVELPGDDGGGVGVNAAGQPSHGALGHHDGGGLAREGGDTWEETQRETLERNLFTWFPG